MMPASAILVRKAPTVTPTRLAEITSVHAPQDTTDRPAILTLTNARWVKIAASVQQISPSDESNFVT